MTQNGNYPMKAPPSPIQTDPALHLLATCTSPRSLLQLHAHLLTTGLANHTIPLLPLLRSSSLLLGPAYASAVLGRFPRRPTTFLFNTLLSIFSSHRHPPRHSWSLYCSLVYDHRLAPNSHSYPSLLKSLCSSSYSSSSEEEEEEEDWWFYGRCVHTHVVKLLGGEADGFVGAALLGLYGKLGRIGSCRQLFDEMRQRDLAAWNSVLAAYSRCGGVDEDCFGSNLVEIKAMELFREMQRRSDVVPDEMTLVAVIGVCGDVGALAQGAWAHAYVQRNGRVALNRFVGTALIEMYGKCGRLDLASQLFDELPMKDTACYNAMIRGLAVHGHGHHALELFERMKLDGVGVNDVTMVVVMCACAHSGLLEDGHRCFEEMGSVVGIVPKIEHYCCLVDLLGRAGRLEEAIEVVRRMPMKPSATVYRSLLGACRAHGEMEFGEDVIKCLLKLEPRYSGNYVILSNLYAYFEHWDDAKRVRGEMRDKGISKTPGLSSIEINGVVHEFSTDDRTYSRSTDIYVMLEEMGRTLHR